MNWFFRAGIGFKNNLNFENQLKYAVKALEIRQRVFNNNDHPDLARSYLNVAQAYRNLNDPEHEIKFLLKSNQIYERLYKDKVANLDLANCYSQLGCAFGSNANPNLELDYKEEALDMKETMFQGDHYEIARTLNNISNAYKNLGNYKCQLKYAVNALNMYRRLYEGDHFNLAASLNNGRLKSWKSSYFYICKELRINMENFCCFFIVGIAYGCNKEYKLELYYLSRAMNMYRRLYNGDNVEMVTLLNVR